jgi:hypothetical protein
MNDGASEASICSPTAFSIRQLSDHRLKQPRRCQRQPYHYIPGDVCREIPARLAPLLPVGLLSRHPCFLFIHHFCYRRIDSGIVVSQPLLHRFSLRERSYPLPARATCPNRVLGHKVVVRIIDMDYFAGVGTLAVKGITNIGVVMVLH